ncbi:MAG: hypothetical protein U9Q92_01875 [archaeon]|nr:hypothetical protein [archaeon]
MEFVNVRAEYLRAVHYFYFLVSVVSLAVAFLSYETVVIFAFLFVVSLANIFISLLASRSVDRYFKNEDNSGVLNYALLFFIGLFFVFAPLYVGFVSFDTMQQWVIIVSYFFFFWAFGNYLLTRIKMVGDLFRIVRLTKYHFGISKLVDIFTNPEYEGLVDVLNLIEPRLVKYYEPGTSKAVDDLLLMIVDERNASRLRKLVVEMGIALYEYELEELVSVSGKAGAVDNSSLIRRFGYKKKLLELVEV